MGRQVDGLENHRQPRPTEIVLEVDTDGNTRSLTASEPASKQAKHRNEVTPGAVTVLLRSDLLVLCQLPRHYYYITALL